VGLSNEHERTIARIVDKLAAEGRLDLSTIDKIIAALDFTMSRSASKFLVAYIRWQMDHPIVRP